jgi:hypothetical protein
MWVSSSRGENLAGAAAAALAATAFPALLRATAATAMMVYKDPACGCCEKWVGLMRAAGFETSVKDTTDMAAIKQRYHVGPALASCHTALVSGYVVEGHVPADLIRKMLQEKPKILGLSVPGMVTGSPGMEGAIREPYQVLSFDAAGKTTVYARR